jgi:hypothetical protein
VNHGRGANPKRQGFAPDNSGPAQNLRCARWLSTIEFRLVSGYRLGLIPGMKPLLSFVVVILLVPVLVEAADKKDKDAKPKPYIKVAAVDPANNTIVITDTDGNDKEYKVDQFTTIVMDGKPVKLTPDLKGLKADVTASGTKISKLELSDPPVAKPTKKKK